MLRENAHNRLLQILVLAVAFVCGAEHVHGEKRESHEERMPDLRALFPGGLLAGVRFSLVVISTTVQPVSIAVDLKVIEVLELVERMVLHVVALNLVIFGRLRLILKAACVGDASGLVRARDWLLTAESPLQHGRGLEGAR